MHCLRVQCLVLTYSGGDILEVGRLRRTGKDIIYADVGGGIFTGCEREPCIKFAKEGI